MRIAPLVTAIILALFTTVTGAWWCAVRSPNFAPPQQPDIAVDASRTIMEALGWTALPTWPDSAPIVLQEFHTNGFGYTQVDVYEAAVFPDRAPAQGIAFTPGAMNIGCVGTRIESGWPRPCLRGTRFRGSRSAGAWIMDMGMETPVALDRYAYAPERFLPLQPVWSGMAINTAVMTGGFLVLFALLAVLRGRVRIRRGRCPVCAYPVTAGSDRCPECGRAASPRVTPPDPSSPTRTA